MCTFFGTFVFSSIPQNVSFACNWSSMIYRRWALIYMQFWALNSINYLRSIELGDFFNQYERSFIMLVILNSINYWGSTRLFMIINAFIFDNEFKKNGQPNLSLFFIVRRSNSHKENFPFARNDEFEIP